VAIVLEEGALGEVIEAETTFQKVGVRKGRQARSLSYVLYLVTGDADNDRKDQYPFATFIGGELAEFLRKN
jgi:hypothetical protein